MGNILYVKNNTKPFFSQYLCISFPCRACTPKMMNYWFCPWAKIITTCSFKSCVQLLLYVLAKMPDNELVIDIFFFLIWECLSVVNFSILIFSFFNLFKTLTNANFSIFIEFPAWLNWHISISMTFLLAWSKMEYVIYLTQCPGLSQRPAPRRE